MSGDLDCNISLQVAEPVCHNTPSFVKETVKVTVSFPVAEKKCEQKPISLPK